MTCKLYTTLLFIFLFSLESQANIGLIPPPSDTTKIDRNSVSGFPIAYFTPETDWAFGAVGVYAFRLKGMKDDSRPSQISLAGAYTLNNQILFYVPFQIFWKNARWNWYGEIGYYRYNYFYYGIGNDTRAEDEEVYDVNYPRLKLNALYRVYPKIYAGIKYWYDGYDIVKIEDDGLLAETRPLGVEGGRISGFGGAVNYDDRDNLFSTATGTFAEVGFLLSRAATGSNYDFSKYTADYRRFISIGADKKSVLALNAYAEFSTGEVPFYQLAFLGGSRRMRGYVDGQYRDRHYAATQAEYRFPIFWRFGGVVFASTGGVGSEVSDIPGNLRFAAGGGLRFLLNEQEGINIRVDYGIGEEGSSGFYLTIGEAF